MRKSGISRELKKNGGGAEYQVVGNFIHPCFQPEKLLELGCQWNYRAAQYCHTPKNICPVTQSEGVSIIHGNALAFVKGDEMKMQKIFEGFERHDLTKDTPGKLFIKLKAALAQVDRKKLPSKCKKVRGIDKILLGQLKSHIRG